MAHCMGACGEFREGRAPYVLISLACPLGRISKIEVYGMFFKKVIFCAALTIVAGVVSYCVFVLGREIRMVPRTYGYEFVDGWGSILAQATSLEEIDDVLESPSIKPKLGTAKFKIHYLRISVGQKGFQVPEGTTCGDINRKFKEALESHGIEEFSVVY